MLKKETVRGNLEVYANFSFLVSASQDIKIPQIKSQILKIQTQIEE
ncbi:hypothetical protein CLV93_105128 [Prolixibacter denitrificans]|uniref:Uncharacterized protein n=1 Tax=Prolixibacter denitrificans TaxID=1541063 RepID=A0A2P8CCN1_9BACT|nr:hypothetical protein CLV93_105128 [Prolixibacter denitrificans]